MPIFFHCSRIISAICVNCTNWPPRVMISMRSRPLPSLRSRKPSASFLARPILSSISLAFLTSSVAHIFRYCGPGLYLLLSAGTTEPGVPVPSQNVSLI